MADSVGWYTIIAVIQIAVAVVALMLGGFLVLKTQDLSDKFVWNIARTVVVFLPLALAWFGLFSAMFLENANLLLPILVGVTAVGLNFGIDALLKRFWG